MSLEELPPEQTNDLTDEAVLSPEYDTINEPIKDSLMRDVQSIVRKLRVVLIPQRKNEFEKELKNCIFPRITCFIFHFLILCTSLF